MSNWMVTYNTSDLMHHGIKGQRWGVRRFQNEDGTLTAAGRKRYYNTYDAYTKAKIEYSKNKTAENKAKVKQLKKDVKQSWKDLDTAYRMDKGKKVSKEDMQRILDQNKNIKGLRETYMNKVAARAETGKKVAKGLFGGALAAAAITGGVLYFKKNRQLKDEDNRTYEQFQNMNMQRDLARARNLEGINDFGNRIAKNIRSDAIQYTRDETRNYIKNNKGFKTNRRLKNSIEVNKRHRDNAAYLLDQRSKNQALNDTFWSNLYKDKKIRGFFK